MNPMHAMKLIVRELIADSGRLWRATSFAARLPCWARPGGRLPGRRAGTGCVRPDQRRLAAEVLSQLSELVRGAELRPARGHGSARRSDSDQRSPAGQRSSRKRGPHSTAANRSEAPSRSQSDDRRSRGRRSSRSSSSQPGGSGSANDYSRGSDGAQTNTLAGTNNGPVTLDYAAFKVIVDRNIFDPNRYPHRPGEPRVRVEAQER